MNEEEAYKIFSEMTPDVLDYVFCLAKAYTEKDEEIERLNSIIKEVREYINKNLAKDDNGCGCWWYSFEYYVNAKKELLEILDKVNNKTNEAMPVEELEKYEPKNMAELEYQEWFWEDNE